MAFHIRLLDNDQHLLATASVEDTSGCFSGTLCLCEMPALMRHVFEEYEQLANNQVFSLLDEIENRIEAMAIRGQFNDGRMFSLATCRFSPKLARFHSESVRNAPVRTRNFLAPEGQIDVPNPDGSVTSIIRMVKRPLAVGDSPAVIISWSSAID